MSEDKPGAGVAGFSPPEPERKREGEENRGAHSAWYSPNVAGLQRRHVKSIRIVYEDAPPSSIAKARLEDIVHAMHLGFEKLDRPIDESAARMRAGLSRSQED